MMGVVSYLTESNPGCVRTERWMAFHRQQAQVGSDWLGEGGAEGRSQGPTGKQAESAGPHPPSKSFYPALGGAAMCTNPPKQTFLLALGHVLPLTILSPVNTISIPEKNCQYKLL